VAGSLTGLPEATRPDGRVPQQLHLDTRVPTVADLNVQHEQALALGARLLQDRSDDPVTASGGLGVMRQFIGGNRVVPLTETAGVTDGDDGMTPPMVRDLLLSVSPRRGWTPRSWP
jgi:hypothetical protein